MRRPRRLGALLAALVALPLAAPAPVAAQLAAQLARGMAVAPDVSVRLYNLTGATRVVGWDRDSIDVRGQVAPGAGRLYVGGTRTGVKVGVESPFTASGSTDGAGATLEIRVPRGAQLWIKSASAPIEVRDVAGALDLYSVSGTITVTGQPSLLTAEAMDGEVRVTGTAETMRLRTAGGGVTLAGGAEDLTVASVSGAIRVDGARVTHARLESVTGRITFLGTVVRGGSLEVQTHRAPVQLALPRDLDADFTVTAYEGLVTNRFGGRPGAFARGKPLHFTAGSGGAQVTVRSLKGDVSIFRR